MEQLALGEIGLSVKDFYSLTPRQFDNILIGYAQKKEQETRHLYETTRMIMYATQSLYAKKKSFKPTDIIKFPWDEEKEQKITNDKPRRYKTPDELKALFNNN